MAWPAYGGGYEDGSGEIIAAGQPFQSALVVFDAFKASSGHDAVMKSSYSKVAGVAQYFYQPDLPHGYAYYWTVDFGSSFTNASAHGFEFFEENSHPLLYSGDWTTVSEGAASGGSWSYISTEGDLTAYFNGTSLSWVAKTGPARGIARVTLNDNDPVDVDLYSPTYKHQRCVYSTGTLPEGDYRVKIEWTGTKNPAATHTRIAVDAIDIQGTPTVSRHQQNHELLAYSGNWTTYSDSGASGGSFVLTGQIDAAVNVKFDGSYLAYVAKKGPNRGKVEVTLKDGSDATVDTKTVDLYSSSYLQKQRVYDTRLLDLEPGVYTLTITNLFEKNPASTRYRATVDAFDVMGELVQAPDPPAPPPVPITYQQSDPKIGYIGNWTTYSDPGASGGSFVLSGQIGAAAVVSFVGTEVALIAKTGPNRGMAQVTVKDSTGAVVGGEKIDLYDPTYKQKQNKQKQKVFEVTGLDDEAHTLTMTNLLEKNPASTRYRITLDAVGVLGTLTNSSTRYQQNHGYVGYTGNWTTYSDSGASGGSFVLTGEIGATVTTQFEGVGLGYVAKTGPTRGKVQIVLKDSSNVTVDTEIVDLYSPTYLQQRQVYHTGLLPEDTYILTITNILDKNPASTRYRATVDAFDVMGELISP
jgi:3D (Asp-Asp-Asp) domain-containing protein